MKTRTQPLLGAAMVGIVLLVVYYLITSIMSYQLTQRMFDSGLFDPEFITDPNAAPPFDPTSDDPIEMFFGIPSERFALISVISSLGSCLVWLGAGLGTGAVYAVLHHREESLLETPVRGGAAAGALAYVIGTLLGSLMSLAVAVPIWEEMSGLFTTLSQQSGGMPPGFPAQMLAFWGVSFVVGIICSTLFFGAIGAALGALGSAIGKAIVTRGAAS